MRIGEFRFDALVWRSLDIPVRVAYFVYSSAAGKAVAHYPSQDGSVASLVKTDAWNDIERANPMLMRLVPDVQALLVKGIGAASEGWIVGIDVCYRLVASLRSSWLEGDPKNALEQSLKQFFDGLPADVPCS